MYKTLNRVFSKKKTGKSQPADTQDAAQLASPDNATSTPPKPETSARPESPLRLGSPSVGEATVKRVVKRIFHPDGFQVHSTTQQSNLVSQTSSEGATEGAKEGATEGAEDTKTDIPRPAKSKEVPTEMLAFEIGSIMRRMLEIHDSMSEKMLSSLRSNLQAPGVVTLIANDLRVLWGLAGYEKQQELRLVACRVSVLGRKCNDQRLRKLRVLFDELDNAQASFTDYAATPQESEMLVRFMREQAEATDKLKSEMESIQLLHTRIQEYGEWNSLQEMVTQGKLVEKLQGHCLWSYNLDYLVQVLVIAMCSLRKRIFASFGTCACPEDVKRASLGESGLALHYANVVVLLERIIQQPDAVLGPTRDELYGMLPRNIQYLLRVQLQDPLNFTSDGRIEANLKRGLLLLPTMAHNTIHWHSRHTPGATLDSSETVFQVQTFYYANRTAVNAALVDVLLGLCRICGVENPIGFISVQSVLTGDTKQALAKAIEEEQKEFSDRLGAEDRENKFGGEVTKIVDTIEEKEEASEKAEASENDQKFVSEAMAELAGRGEEGSSGETETDDSASKDGHVMKRANSARLSEDFTKIGASKEDPITVARSGTDVSDVSSGAVAKRLIFGKEAPGSFSLRRKSHSQRFARGLGVPQPFAKSAEWGRPASSSMREGTGVSTVEETGASPEPQNPLRRALPSGGIVGCFAAMADSDEEEEGGGGVGKARGSRRMRSSMKSLSKKFAPPPAEGSSPSLNDNWRKTKHYHSQPLTRPKPDLA